MSNTFIDSVIANVQAKSVGPVSCTNHRVTINFHPDRFTVNGVPLLTAIKQSGELKSQFDTQTSNGGLSAFSGGARWEWESRAFDRAYDSAPNHARPKYGGLNFRSYEFGASPRFGSAYFCLKPQVLSRTTFCYPDSTFNPDAFASFEHTESLMTLANKSKPDLLDDYIEAHVHGRVLIDKDVEFLALDPVYRDTGVAIQAESLDLPVHWHKGFALSIDDLSSYSNYRGERIMQIAKKIANEGLLNPELIGLAALHSKYPNQEIKKVWHCLARYGYRGHQSL